MRTIRNNAGVTYQVNVMSAAPAHSRLPFCEYAAWRMYVLFGKTEATVAGGAAFVGAARLQEQIAAEVWAATAGAETDWRVGEHTWWGRRP